MTAPPPPPPSPASSYAWLLRLLLHLAAAGVCFAFFTVVPIGAGLILTMLGNDPGGSMFLPILGLGALLFASVITVTLGGATWFSDWLCRRTRLPVWVPPIPVFLLATGAMWLSFPDAPPATPLITGGVFTLAFIIHWAAITAVWCLPRWASGLFRVRQAGQSVTES